MAIFDHGYALLIGITENANPEWALPDVIQDINTLANVLVHPERCAYPSEHVQVISGPKATYAGILAGLQWLDDSIKADNSDNTTAVLYYSGHGWQDSSVQPPGYYLIPYDVNSARLSLTSLAGAAFTDAVIGLQPRRLLVILDCCHAAGIEAKDLDVKKNIQLKENFSPASFPVDMFTKGIDVSLSPGLAKDIRELSAGYGRAILSSSQSDQKSYIRKDRKMSIFTYHLIEAMIGHAGSAAGAKEVLISDILSYVWREVPKSAKSEYGVNQQPDYRGNGNFPVAILLGGKGVEAGKELPSPIQPLPVVPGQTVYQINTEGGHAFIKSTLYAKGNIVLGDQININKPPGKDEDRN